MFEVHISKHSRFFSLRWHSQDHGRLSGVWCGVGGVLCGVCACGACGVWVVCVHVVLCVVLVVCVRVLWCVVKLGTLSLSLLLSLSFLLSLLLSSLSFLPLLFPCLFFLSSFFFSLLFLFPLLLLLLFSSFFSSTKHWVKNRSTNKLRGVRMWSGGTRQLDQKKKEGTFHYRNIPGERFIFYYSFKLIQKNRRRGKLVITVLY